MIRNIQIGGGISRQFPASARQSWSFSSSSRQAAPRRDRPPMPYRVVRDGLANCEISVRGLMGGFPGPGVCRTGPGHDSYGAGHRGRMMTQFRDHCLKQAAPVCARSGLPRSCEPAGQNALRRRIPARIGNIRVNEGSRTCQPRHVFACARGDASGDLCRRVFASQVWGLIAGCLFGMPAAAAITRLNGIMRVNEIPTRARCCCSDSTPGFRYISVPSAVGIGRRALRDAPVTAIAATCLVAIFALVAPFLLISLAEGAIGAISACAGVAAFPGRRRSGQTRYCEGQ